MQKQTSPLGMLLRSLFVMVVLLLLTCPLHADSSPSKPAVDRPNFVIIFIDDMGYGDIGPFGVGTYGDIKIDTPNLDRMAKEGRRFTDFYVTQAVCSASRAGLMTGCYPMRVGIRGVLFPFHDEGINAEETTIAEIVKQKGYTTACIGKWHLGHHPKFLPTHHGFDEYYGLPYSNDMWPPNTRRPYPNLRLIENEKVVDEEVTSEDQCQLTTKYTERAVDFIKRNQDRPFLLYLPHAMIHVPHHVSKKYRGKSAKGLYGDVVMEVDWSVGQILDALQKYKLDKKTMVIFTSDNGPIRGGSAGPLRGGKGGTFEGGFREPTIMWWPGTIPADTTCSIPAMTIDLLPTIAYLADAPLPKLKIDGKKIWPLIAGTPGAKSPQEAYYYYSGSQLQAVRMGKWKLHFPHRYGRTCGRQRIPGTDKYILGSGKIGLSLFDLENDIGETTNVADKHPEIVKKMKALGEKMRADLGDRDREKYPGPGRREPGRLGPNDARSDWPIVPPPEKKKTEKKK